MELQIDTLKKNEQERKGRWEARWDTSDRDWLASNNI